MSNITKLKDFLLEHRTDYLSATRFVSFSSKDEEHTQFRSHIFISFAIGKLLLLSLLWLMVVNSIFTWKLIIAHIRRMRKLMFFTGVCPFMGGRYPSPVPGPVPSLVPGAVLEEGTPWSRHWNSPNIWSCLGGTPYSCYWSCPKSCLEVPPSPVSSPVRGWWGYSLVRTGVRRQTERGYLPWTGCAACGMSAGGLSCSYCLYHCCGCH